MNNDQRVETIQRYMDEMIKRNTNFTLDSTIPCPVCNNVLDVKNVMFR